MSKRGFTSIELMLVIGIIATLAAILFPVFAKARERARAASCQSNLFNIGLALRLYSQDHEGRYPPQHNVLDPLYPDYLPLQQSLVCPSGQSQAGEHLPPQAPGPASAPSTCGSGRPPAPPPPAPVPAAGPAEPPGGPGGATGMPGGPPGTPSAPPVAAKPLSQVLTSSYYYQAGLRHDPSGLLPLVADDAARHNARANVLFTDGSLRMVPCTEWYLLWKLVYRPTPGVSAGSVQGGGEE